MDTFVIGKQFESYEALIIAKSAYENASNTLLIKQDCRILKGDGDFVNKFKYDYVVFGCKAGKERRVQSLGLRQSFTIKRNCPAKVELSCEFATRIFFHLIVFIG